MNFLFGTVCGFEELTNCWIEEKRRRIEEYRSLFELDDFINTPVRNLSLGQRIRCEIVASLIHEPKILTMDEPFVGLDPKATYTVKTVMKEFCDKFLNHIFPSIYAIIKSDGYSTKRIIFHFYLSICLHHFNLIHHESKQIMKEILELDTKLDGVLKELQDE